MRRIIFQAPSTPRRRNLKTPQLSVILDLCLRKTGAEKSRVYRDVIVFEKLCFQNGFRLQLNVRPAFSNSSGLKSVFIKLRCRDGLVWTVGLTVEKKLRFEVSLGYYGRGVSGLYHELFQYFVANQRGPLL